MLTFIIVTVYALGFGTGWAGRIMWQGYLKSRDNQVKTQIEKEYVRLRVDEATTEELLDELSTRDFKTEKMDY